MGMVSDYLGLFSDINVSAGASGSDSVCVKRLHCCCSDLPAFMLFYVQVDSVVIA
jgi:hypothetical protein